VDAALLSCPSDRHHCAYYDVLQDDFEILSNGHVRNTGGGSLSKYIAVSSEREQKDHTRRNDNP